MRKPWDAASSLLRPTVRRTASSLLILLTAVPLFGVTVPTGLPSHFALGVTAHPDSSGIYGWMPQSGVPWDYAYQYLAGGVNTGNGWATWNSNATFPLLYAQGSASNGYIPVFPYYMLLQSDGPCNACDENQRDLANLNSNSTMAAFYADFILLMKRLGPGRFDGVQGFGRAAIVQVEPDFFGYAQQSVLNNGVCFGHCTGQGDDPAFLKAAVASTGVAEAQGFPDTFVGFNLALLHIRDLYAPNVLLALHVSNWAPLYDVGSSSDPTLDVAALGRSVGTFANLCGVAPVRSGVSRYDLLFNDVCDRDAGFYKYVYGNPNAWWDRQNVALPNFHRWETYLGAVVQTTGRPAIVWQIPTGNQYFRTMNNSWGHYQDNRVEYFLAHPRELVDIGVIGLLFGLGNGGSTAHWDANSDGVTNPAAICNSDGTSGGPICNDHDSVYPDDDGGYLRITATSYYANPIDLGGGGGGNRAPHADAGPDQGVDASTLVQLDGSESSDPDGDPIHFAWEQTGGPAVTLSGASVARPSFAAPVLSATLTFRLTVRDASLNDTDSVQIDVTAGGSGGAPVINSVTSRKGHPGNAARISGSGFGSDPRLVAVTFGSTRASVTKVIPTAITCKIPKKLKRGAKVPVVVRVGGVASNAVLFTVR